MKSKAIGCGSISTVFSSIVLLCVSSIIVIIITAIIIITTSIILIIIIIIIIIKRAYSKLCSGQSALVLIGWFERVIILCGGTKVQKFIVIIQVVRLVYWLPLLVACAVRTFVAS